MELLVIMVMFCMNGVLHGFVIFKEPQDNFSKQLALKEKLALKEQMALKEHFSMKESLMHEQLDNARVGSTTGSKCYPLSIPICRRLGYNSTSANNNIYDHSRYSDIEIEKYLHFFENEICFEDLLFFICTLFNPVCFENYPKPVLPCRSECRNVKKQCKKTIKKFQLDWPTKLKCNSLPDYETDVCLTGKSIVTIKQLARQNEAEVRKTNSCGKCKQVENPPQEYKQFQNSHYAIEGQFLSKTKTADNGLKLSFLVNKVFKQGGVPIIKRGIIHLWSNSPCLCPSLVYDNKYIIMGRESSDFHRLIYDRDTFVVQKTRFWKRLLIQWKRKYRLYVRQQILMTENEKA